MSDVGLTADDTEDPDAVAAAAFRPVRRSVVASGPRSVAVGGDNDAPITTGDRSPVIDRG